jgi:MoxR-like ATPase
MDSSIKPSIELLINNIKQLISVDTQKLEYIIAAQVAGGHVILADSHGVGKTSLARMPTDLYSPFSQNLQF